MPYLLDNLRILVIEDNPGDFVLIEDYLIDEFSNPVIEHKKTFADAREVLTDNAGFDAILLDLSLPDKSGEALAGAIIKLSENTPVIVLTGYENREFGLKTLSMGISDYLLKDELNPFVLGKSISYSIERNRISSSLKQSEKEYRDFFNFNPQPMWVFDANTLKFLDVNQAAITNYGYCREELLDMTIRDISPQEDLHILEQALDEVNKNDNQYFEGIYRHQIKDGSIIDVKIKTNKIDFRGKNARLVLANNITRQLLVEKEIKLSEQRFRSLVQDGSDLIAILDCDSNFKYVSSNSQVILGFPADEFIGKKILHYIHQDDQSRLENILTELSFKERLEVAPFRFRDGQGNWRWFETIITNLLNNPAIEGFVANSRDVTEKIEQELKLKKSLERYDIVSKATSDTIWDMDLQTDTMIYNNNIYNNFGYSSKEVDSVANWWKLLIHPEDRVYVNKKFREALTFGNDRFQLEYRFKASDGSYKNIFDRAFVIKDEDGQPVRIIGAMQDVTQAVKEGEQLKLLESVVTNTNDSVVITEANPSDSSGRKIIFANAAFTGLTGYSDEEAIGSTMELLNGPETDRAKIKNIKQLLASCTISREELLYYRKDGSTFWISLSILPVYNKNGDCSHWVMIGRDISEQKKQDTELRESLREKETLLSEIHHRVKNNLAIISSLMELQALNSNNEEVKQSLLVSVLRIKSMAEIHEQLYQSASFSQLKFSKSLKSLVNNIINTLETSTKIDLSFNINPLELNINQSVPCSLLVNEVITNILKHGFNGREKGQIQVSLDIINDNVTLQISDNGNGLPKNLHELQESSMGLKLIELLTLQIEGSNEHFSDEKGTTFVLKFEKMNAKGSSNSLLI